MKTKETKFKETEIGKIPEDWGVVKLSDVASFKNGHAFYTDGYSNNGLIAVDLLNISEEGKFKLSGRDKFVSFKLADKYRKFVLNKGDLVMAMTDMTANLGILGRCAIVPENDKYILNQRIGRIVPDKKKIDPNFIYWYLNSVYFLKPLHEKVLGTVQYYVNTGHITENLVLVPSKPEQIKIAEVLGALDEKIELNRKMNKTLEELGESVFNNFILENEEYLQDFKLKEVGKIVCGKTPSKSNSNFFKGNIPFIKIPDMHNQAFILKTIDTLTNLGRDSQNNKTIPAGSICVSCIATVGLVSLAAEDSQTNQQINSIIPNTEELTYFLYITLKNMKEKLRNMASGGSATLNMNTGSFSEIEIKLLQDEQLLEFHIQVFPLFQLILNNSKEIETLSQVRDSLLPKLISGKVRAK